MAIAALQIVRDSTENTDAPEYGFSDFWALYPRKEARKDAMKAWDQVITAGEVGFVLTALYEWRKVWAQQQRQTNHIPLAASWIRGERFHDELPTEYAPRAASHTPFPAKPNEPHVRTELPDHVKAAIAKVRKS